MQDPEFNSETLEVLLREVAANQHSLHATLSEVYDKLDNLETRLETLATERGSSQPQASADDLYDEAYALAVTGSLISVPYLARKLATSEHIAHELLEKLRDEGVVGTVPADDEDEEFEVGDAFTTIDLKEATSSAVPDYAGVKAAVISAQTCSAAWLKRQFAVNDEVAKQWLRQLEAEAVIAPAEGRKPRQVLVVDLDND